MKINILGLDKEKVLLTLYDNVCYLGDLFNNNSEKATLIFLAKKKGKLSLATQLIKERGEKNDFFFDYVDLGVGSRPLKVNLSNDEFDSEDYDEVHGVGAASRAISLLTKPSSDASGDIVFLYNKRAKEQEEIDNQGCCFGFLRSGAKK